ARPRAGPRRRRRLRRRAAPRARAAPRREQAAVDGARDFKKSDGLLREGTAVRCVFIRDHQAEFPVEVLCRVLGVSRSGYFAWRDRPPSPTAGRREHLVERIREAHRESRATYGSHRVYRELKAQGVTCCENTVAKLMRAHDIRSKARRRF